MRKVKWFLAIVILFLLPSYNAYPYDYTWDDYRKPFTQLVRVPAHSSGTSMVYLDLPEDIIKTHQELTLNLDIESNLLLKHDGLEQRSFEMWSAYCSVNGAGFFGKQRLRVNDLPPRQTCSILIATKDLKGGKNTLEFSMSPGPNLNLIGLYNNMVIAYGIHRMWFSEFSAPSQAPTFEKAKDAPADKTNKKQGDSDIETRLKGLKQLLDKGLINQEDYNRKKAELLDQL